MTCHGRADVAAAQRIAHQLDNYFYNEQMSLRGFKIFTGKFNNVRAYPFETL